MKVLGYRDLIRLSESSRKAGRSRHLAPEQVPIRRDDRYIANFHFDHEWQGRKDVRLSVILEPGVRTAWLDVSPEEYAAIKEVLMTEMEWEAAVCVGIPRWEP